MTARPDPAHPTLAEAIRLADDGRGALTVERRQILWRYHDGSRGREESFGAFRSNATARQVLAAVRARVHLGGTAA